MPVLFTFWACTTVPETSDTVQTAPDEADTSLSKEEDSPDESPEEVSETAAGPLFRVDRVNTFLANGVLDTVTEMVYADGHLLEERVTYVDGSAAGLVSYTYENGRLVSSVKTDRYGKQVSAYSYAYDDAGNLVEEALLDSSGNSIFAYRYSYDSDSRRTGLEIVSSDGFALSYAEYLYSNGMNERIETFNLFGEMQEYLDRTFDDDGRPVLEVVSEVGGTELEKVRFEYSENLLVGRETYVQARKTGAAEYRYDPDGNLAVRIRYDRTGSIIETKTYSYIEVAK